MKEIVLMTFGTTGDIHPFLALSIALQNRGHQVTLISYDIYQEMVEREGIKFIPCDSSEYRETVIRQDVNHPVRFMNNVGRVVLASMRDSYHILANQFNPKNIVVLAHFPLVIGARIAQEKFKFPLISVCLSPAAILSTIKLPHLPMLPSFAQNCPYIIRRAFLSCIEKYMDYLFLSQINQFRHELGLNRLNNMYQWLPSVDKIICLFPKWFAEIQSDWPPQTQQTGFIEFVETKKECLSDALIKFLNAGSSPIVFTYGSQLVPDKDFFNTSIEVINQLGLRALILTNYPETLPPLPNNIMSIDYAPFHLLIPRTLAIVHHAGMGTMIQALANKVPQLAVPHSTDQFENAFLIEKLGFGLSLLPKNYSVNLLKKKITILINSTEIRQNCCLYSKLIDFDSTKQEVCEIIEEIMAK